MQPVGSAVEFAEFEFLLTYSPLSHPFLTSFRGALFSFSLLRALLLGRPTCVREKLNTSLPRRRCSNKVKRKGMRDDLALFYSGRLTPGKYYTLPAG